MKAPTDSICVLNCDAGDYTGIRPQFRDGGAQWLRDQIGPVRELRGTTKFLLNRPGGQTSPGKVQASHWWPLPESVRRSLTEQAWAFADEGIELIPFVGTFLGPAGSNRGIVGPDVRPWDMNSIEDRLRIVKAYAPWIELPCVKAMALDASVSTLHLPDFPTKATWLAVAGAEIIGEGVPAVTDPWSMPDILFELAQQRYDYRWPHPHCAHWKFIGTTRNWKHADPGLLWKVPPAWPGMYLWISGNKSTVYPDWDPWTPSEVATRVLNGAKVAYHNYPDNSKGGQANLAAFEAARGLASP